MEPLAYATDKDGKVLFDPSTGIPVLRDLTAREKFQEAVYKSPAGTIMGFFSLASDVVKTILGKSPSPSQFD